jgi:hypothetical protein
LVKQKSGKIKPYLQKYERFYSFFASLFLTRESILRMVTDAVFYRLLLADSFVAEIVA